VAYGFPYLSQGTPKAGGHSQKCFCILKGNNIMKIRDLINCLEEIEKEHGDIQCQIEGPINHE
jgi:hypothetical protein